MRSWPSIFSADCLPTLKLAPDAAYQPKTALGRRLWELRRQVPPRAIGPLGFHGLERDAEGRAVADDSKLRDEDPA